MKGRITFTDIEYGNRRRMTEREEFLNAMDKYLPRRQWIEAVRPYYPTGGRGRPPREIETMLRMLTLQVWFNLSDEAVENAIFDSYAMKSFMGLNFDIGEYAPDATTLRKFRKLLVENRLQEIFFKQVEEVLRKQGKLVKGGTIVDATITAAPESRKNAAGKPDPEMRSTKKGAEWRFGMRVHIGADPLRGFVHSVTATPANAAEVKEAPKLIREEDDVVYGDAGYCDPGAYVTDGNDNRRYAINRQGGTFKRHYGDSLSRQEEKRLESRKSSVRCKVEYVFHIVKDIFHRRKARYKGITKNNAYAYLAFASVNIYMLATFKREVTA